MPVGMLEIGVSSRNSQFPYCNFKRILITSAFLFSKLVIIPVRVRNKQWLYFLTLDALLNLSVEVDG